MLDLRNPMYASSLANGMRVLETFRSDGPAHTNGSLAKYTGFSKGTITRITHTLCEIGMLRFDPEARLYRISCGALALAYPYFVNFGFQHIARPLMESFAEEHHATVSIAVRDRIQMIYVETSAGRESPRAVDVGTGISLLESAVGHAWFSAQTIEVQGRFSLEVSRQVPQLWRRRRLQIREANDQYRKHFYCIDHETQHCKAFSVATALSSHVAGETVVLEGLVPESRTTAQAVQVRIGPALTDLAQAIDSAWTEQTGSAGVAR